MKSKEKLRSIVFFFCCLVVLIGSLKYIIGKAAWSPVDEYAHMDYIEKLTEGRLPKLTDTISQEIYENLIKFPEKSVHKKAETREQLGLGNLSYQSQHPPVYYVVLALPDLILKSGGVDIFSRLVVVRIISYLLFAAGIFILIPLGSLLSKLGYWVPEWYCWCGVLFCLIIGSNSRYGLGNNMLSPLVINVCIFFLLKYYLYAKNNDLYLFVFFAGLSIGVALTNLIIIPFLLLAGMKKYIPNFSKSNFFKSLLALALPVAILIIWKIGSAAMPAFQKQFYLNMASLIPAGVLDGRMFVLQLQKSIFQISFINDKIDLSQGYRFLFIFNLIFSLVFFKTIYASQQWILFCWGAVLLVTCTLLYLNANIPAVTWAAFRHYLGFMPFIYVAATSFLLVVIPKIVNKKWYMA